MKILFINGVEIVMVSKLMGLNISKTTEIYTHVNTKNIYHIKSPFDDLKKHILTKVSYFAYISNVYTIGERKYRV